jgi:hypothetical protein
MTWQILIASVYSRTRALDSLLARLSKQASPFAGEVGILVDRDDCDQPVGVKRTRLVQAATAEHVCFVDDDDDVRDDYIAQIMYLLTGDPDYVGFRVAYSIDGARQKDAIHKLGQPWSETEDAYLRGISHLNPIRREAALAGLPFRDGFGEDHEWSEKVEASGLVKVGAYIDECLYHYRYSSQGSLFKAGPQRVGSDPGLPSYPFVEVLA